MQPKSILYLSRAVLPSAPTHTLSIMRMAQAFADAGHRVVLLGWSPTAGAPDPIAHYGLRGRFRVERLNLEGSSKLLSRQMQIGMAARRLIREIRADVVYSRLTQGELYWLPREIPIVYETHSLGPWGDEESARLFRWVIRTKNFRRIVATTDMTAKHLRERVGNIEVTVARLSAEPPIDIPPVAQDGFRRHNLQGQSFKWHVGYTGALDKKDIRGTDIICRTAAEVPEAAFHIVGGEPKMVEHWQAFAKDTNRHGNLFFYGHRNPAEMPLFLGCFDVVLAPLKYRPSARAPLGQGMSPLKLPQYMAYGKAIVASDIPAHHEVLKDGETALLASPDDIGAWAQAVRRFLEAPELRERLGAQARARYFAEHTPEARVARVLEGI